MFGINTNIFFDGGFARFGPNSSEVDFQSGSLFTSSITLPTNGQTFRAPVDIGFLASGIFLANGETIGIGGDAQGYITFEFINGAYYPGAFVEVPEPSTLALIGTGLLWIFARTRRKGAGRA